MPIERILIQDDPVVSVVVPTIPQNDHCHIRCGLVNQEFDRGLEILIVSDDTLDICEARNTGIEEAQSDIIALTDDDCSPPKEWVQEIYRCFQTYDDLIGIEGSISGGMNYTGSRHYVGCNLAFDREAALSIGGFNSEFAGWRDDTEFGWRLERDASGRCIYASNVHMYHEPRPRASFDQEKEILLKERFPDRYQEVLNSSFRKRLYRFLLKYGLIEKLNKLRYTGL